MYLHLLKQSHGWKTWQKNSIEILKKNNNNSECGKHSKENCFLWGACMWHYQYWKYTHIIQQHYTTLWSCMAASLETWRVCGKERKTPVITVILVSGGWRESKNYLPPVFQQSFSPTLKQFVKLQLEQLPLWFLRVGAWTIHIDHSERFLLGPAPVDAHSKKKKKKKRKLNAWLITPPS